MPALSTDVGIGDTLWMQLEKWGGGRHLRVQREMEEEATMRSYKVSVQLPPTLNRFLKGLLSPPMSSFKGSNYKTPN